MTIFVCFAVLGVDIAQAQRGSWELTLAGVGTSNKDFDEHALGLRGSIGYFIFDPVELSLRQQVTYSKVEGSSATDAGTALAIDFHFPIGSERRWVPYIGASAGYFYGDTFGDDFEAAPEIGLKYFVNRTTFIYAHAEYQIFFNGGSGGSGGGSSDDRQFIYQVGIGFRF